MLQITIHLNGTWMNDESRTMSVLENHVLNIWYLRYSQMIAKEKRTITLNILIRQLFSTVQTIPNTLEMQVLPLILFNQLYYSEDGRKVIYHRLLIILLKLKIIITNH